MYDDKDNLIEVYFDITKQNNFEDITNHYYDDLFLDIVLGKNGKMKILDEDELDMALNEKVISSKEYDFAKKTAKDLYDYISLNKQKIIDFCEYEKKRLRLQIERGKYERLQK